MSILLQIPRIPFEILRLQTFCHRWTDGRMDRWTDRRTDRQPKNILPPSTKGGGSIIKDVNQDLVLVPTFCHNFLPKEKQNILCFLV